MNKPFSNIPYAAVLAAVVGAMALPCAADTTDVKTQSTVRVAKKGGHCKDDPNCFNRYHPAIKPVVRVQPGQLVVFETRDALDSDLTVNSEPKDLLRSRPQSGASTDRSRVYRGRQTR